MIGRRGRWILSDPGYQQYMPGAEREFTIGPAAHNYPVIDGINQTAKAGRRLALDAPALTACHPEKPALQRMRKVLLSCRCISEHQIVAAASLTVP